MVNQKCQNKNVPQKILNSKQFCIININCDKLIFLILFHWVFFLGIWNPPYSDIESNTSCRSYSNY